jgi:hypothetical protein
MIRPAAPSRIIRFGRGARPGAWDDPGVAPDGEVAPAQPLPAAGESPIGESRWPPVFTVLAFAALTIAVRVWVPQDGVIRVPWLIPAIEVGLIVALLTSDPSSPAERRRLRQLALALVGLLVLASLWATAVLVDDLIEGTGNTNEPADLLASGAIVWLGNNLTFALLYWLMDGGGPIARSRHGVPMDFAFPQQLSPELATSDWRPVFLDYLYLAFTNATAFSPADVMPLTHRAKFAMVVQSTIALALFGLVVARAVGAFQ